MRLTILEDYLNPSKLALFRELAREVELTVLVGSLDGGRFHNTLHPEGFQVQVVPCFELPRWKRHPANFLEDFPIQVPIGLPWALLQSRPDVVWSKEFGARSLLALLLCRALGVPLAVGAHMSWRTESGRGPLRLALRRRLLQWADLVTYNGESCREYLLSLASCESKLSYLPHATSQTPKPQKQRTLSQAHRLLVVSALTPRKGVFRFVKQLSHWLSSEPQLRVHLSLAGRGPEERDLEALPLAENLQLEKLGFVSPEQLPQVYAEHGVLVFPTLSDEWGLVVNEALESGLVVMGSCHSQAVNELIVEGYNGWSYDPEIPGDTEGCLKKLFSTGVEQLNAMREQPSEALLRHHPQNVARLFQETALQALGIRS